MIGIKCLSVCLSFISFKYCFPSFCSPKYVVYLMEPKRVSEFFILLSAFSAFIHFSIAYGSGKVKIQ